MKKGGKYLDTKGRSGTWCGTKLKCEHGRPRFRCKECDGGSICEHDRERSMCKESGGSGICEHGTRRSECKVQGVSRGIHLRARQDKVYVSISLCKCI